MSLALKRLYLEAGRRVASTPALAEFADWPETPPARSQVPQILPVTAKIAALSGDTFIEAIAAAAPEAAWRQTYTQAEVGRAYLDEYGWVELLGPTGHFITDELRAFVGFWGPALQYPAHSHPASEIYLVLKGSARFEVHGWTPRDAGPGETVEIPGGATHAMKIGLQGLLVFALWKGTGIGEDAKLDAARDDQPRKAAL